MYTKVSVFCVVATLTFTIVGANVLAVTSATPAFAQGKENFSAKPTGIDVKDIKQSLQLVKQPVMPETNRVAYVIEIRVSFFYLLFFVILDYNHSRLYCN